MDLVSSETRLRVPVAGGKGALPDGRGSVARAPGDAVIAMARAAFVNTRCQCNHAKKAGMAFCIDCYAGLPKEMQRGLWKRFGRGLEEAYAAAKEWLQQ